MSHGQVTDVRPSLSTLVRTVEPRLPTHRFALGAAVAGSLVRLGLASRESDTLMEALGPAFNTGVAVFLAWAIAREVDPDEPRTANLAALLGLGVVFAAGRADLLALVALLLAGRIAIRITGLPPTLLDCFVLLPVLAFFSGRSLAGWAASLALAFALAHDRRLPEPAGPRTLVAAFVTSAAASAGVVTAGAFGGGWEAPGAVALALLAGGVTSGLALPGYIPTSTGDYTSDPLDFFRLRSGRSILLGGAALAALVAGGPGITGLGAAWAAFVSATLIARRMIPPFGPG